MNSLSIMDKDDLREEVIREIKQECGGSVTEIAGIVNFQFQYLSRIIRDGAYEGVRLPYLGKFHTKVMRIKLITNEAFRRKREQGDG